ncbi:MAG: GDSL-type esterase/lipase family protein [Planctomycetota bacterium]|nr:GDSL-type esterase/lipase family protein [Planctomycetota bacterium]
MTSESRLLLPRSLCPLILGMALVSPLVLEAAPPQASWFPKAQALPKPSGQVLRVRTVDELLTASKEVQPRGTILVADGHYMLPRYFDLTADQVTLRSESGDRHKVILDGANSRHGELVGITGATGVTIADVTVQNVKWNGIKINSNHGAERATIHNCVIHNVWQRGIKAPAMPKAQGDKGPRGCIIRYCLFYNDRPKQFADDETDTDKTFNGNYIGGIDVKNTIDWTITHNVFIGIQGRTREGRGCIYISENGRGCRIERNAFLNCDIAIALGNPSLGYSPLHAIDCVARNNFVSDCPETGILMCYTQDCRIENNTVHDPESTQRRQIWVQNSNAGLQVNNNVLVGAPVLLTTDSRISQSGNVSGGTLAAALAQSNGAGQKFLQDSSLTDVVHFPETLAAIRRDAAAERLKPGILSPDVLKAMREVHSGFKGQAGYVAQFGDSITYSMAFWSPMSWDNPDRFITQDDGLPKAPAKLRWRDYIKGARDKGPKHANYSGWRVGQLLKSIDAVLERDRPEVAIIMIGTNDISGGSVPAAYRSNLEEVVRKCTAAHCVPILNTIPPRCDRDEAVHEANKIIRDVAAKLHVPLADFHAEVTRRRSGDTWDGTLISRDGVHPSGGKSNDYSEANLNVCGYALRNWVNFLVYRQVFFGVLDEDS